MPNSDRGAYLPPPEEPLTFDARRPVRGRAPMPMMLFVSAGILFLLVVGIVVILRSGFGRVSGPAPMVGKPVEAMKVAPPAGDQPEDPARGLQIYQQPEGQPLPAAPNFTPPPEQPQARADLVPAPAPVQPQLAASAMAGSGAPPAFKPAVGAVAPVTKPVAPKPAPVVVLSQTKPAPVVVQAPAQKPVAVAVKPTSTPVKPAPVAPSAAKSTVVAAPPAKTSPAKVVKPAETKAEPQTPAKAASPGAASVQIGAFSSQALADKGWNDAAKIAPGAAVGKGKKVEAVDKGGATLYRTTVTGFASREAATAFCNQLKAAGKNCFVN